MVLNYYSLFWLLPLAQAALASSSPSTASAASSFAACDDNAHPAETTKASSLTPNTFHKLCPSTSSLGPPLCGDGTPFSFYYTSPARSGMRTSSKVLLQFMGGGACWSGPTCDYQADHLTFPYTLDQFLGSSCSAIQSQLEDSPNFVDLPFAMLCAQSIGNLNFRDYHTLVIPYCTQDVYSGSRTFTYNSSTTSSNTRTVHHFGAHNLLAVMDFVYQNFPHPEHIVLTGCSAGGTALPMAYDLLYHHYNRWSTGHGMPLASLMDSPVYLTPDYFLQHGLPHWNAKPLLVDKMRFDYNTYSQREDYSTKLMEHVLKRGSKRDPWGIITHVDDPVSLAYYQNMATATSSEDDDISDDNHNKDKSSDNGCRHLGQAQNQKAADNSDNSDNDDQEQQQLWWSQLSSSFNRILATHANVQSYIINSQGHCSFGLYYAQTEGGDDFHRWATSVLQFREVKQVSGMKWFWVSLGMGLLVLVISSCQQKRQLETQRQEEETTLLLQKDGTENTAATSRAERSCCRCCCCCCCCCCSGCCTQKAPVTFSYGVTVTIYFIRTVTWNHLENWVYNPSLGPTAVTLSAFGINNPTRIVYEHEMARLFASTFLCSGFITWSIILLSLCRYIRPLEHTLAQMAQGQGRTVHFASKTFLEICAMVSFGSNLLYACLGNGASCSSVALILGLLAFSCTMHSYHKQRAFPRPRGATIALFILTTLFLPFNSWIMMLSAMGIGVILAIGVYSPVSSRDFDGSHPGQQRYRTYSSTEDEKPDTHATNGGSLTSTVPTQTTMLSRRTWLVHVILAILGILVAILALRIRKPDGVYEQPFLTGCELVYSTHVSDIVHDYADQYLDNVDQNGQRARRRLNDSDQEESDEDYMCAQFCVPHLVSRPFRWSTNVYTDFDVQRGRCEDVGYGQHIADKTFSYNSYSVGVELYYKNSYNAGSDGDR